MLNNLSLFGSDLIDVDTIDSQWCLWRSKLKGHPILDEKKDGVSVLDKIIAAVDEYKVVIQGDKPVSLRLSGGKDSSAATILFVLALMELKESGAFIPPHHVIASADTLSENPEVSRLLYTAHRQLKDFFAKHDLPVDVIMAYPRLGQTMIGRIVTGRGLPSYPSKDGQCSVERKISSVKATLAAHYKQVGIKQPSKQTVLVLGGRDEESVQRKANLKRFGAEQHVTWSKESQAFEFYPIKSWQVSDIWTLLTLGGNKRGLIPSYAEGFKAIATFYADATGECVFVQGAGESRGKHCSARSGCFDCVRQADDKSMHQLIQSGEQYAYLKGIYKIREFIWRIQWDWSRRNVLGRTATYGFARLRPDVFSFETCRQIFAALITADYDEECRAEEVARALADGEIENTEENRRLARPQFRFVRPQDVCTVDFLWSLHTFNVAPYEAVMIYDQIWNGNAKFMERLDGSDIPTEPVPRTPHPEGFYLFVGDETLSMEERILGDISPWETYNGWQNYGLRDVMAEFCELSFPVAVGTKNRTELMVDAEIGAYFDVDANKAEEIVSWPDFYLNHTNKRSHLPQTAAIELLSRGVVKLGKGKQLLYHDMCLRAQKYNGMRLTGGMSWASIDDIRSKPKLQVLTTSEFRQHKQRLAELYYKWQIWLLVLELNKDSIDRYLEEKQREETKTRLIAMLDDAIMYRTMARDLRLKRNQHDWPSKYQLCRERELDCMRSAVERSIEYGQALESYFIDKLSQPAQSKRNSPPVRERHWRSYLARLEARYLGLVEATLQPAKTKPEPESGKITIKIKQRKKEQLSLF